MAFDYGGTAITLSQLNIDTLGGGLNVLVQSSNNLSSINETFGIGGAGAMNQTGGSNSVTTQLTFGQSLGSSGTYNLSGQATLQTNNEVIGQYGSGSFLQVGGTHVSNDLLLGYNASGQGSYQLSQGVLTAQLTVGYRGSGTFAQFGGNFNSSQVELGYLNGAVGNCVISGNGSFNTTGGLAVGFNGVGFFQQSEGTVVASGSSTLTNGVVIGASAGTGTYFLTGGALSEPYCYIGQVGSGLFNQIGGSNTASTEIDVATNSSATGSYELSGGSVQAKTFVVGESGSGNFQQTGGTVSVTSFGLGLNSNSVGAATFASNAIFNASSSLIVAQSGSATVTQSGGTVLAGQGYSGGVVLAYFPGSTGIYNLSGGTLTSAETIVGYSGTGIFSQTGGTNNSVSLEVKYLTDSTAGSYFLSGNGALVTQVEILGGQFVQSGQSTNTTGSISLGNVTAGTYNLSGGTLAGEYDYIGGEANATFSQSGGLHTASILMVGAHVAGTTGSYDLTGGTVSVTTEYVGGVAGLGVFNQSSGTNNATFPSYDNALEIQSGGTYILSGGTLNSIEMSVESQTGNALFLQSGGANNVSAYIGIGGSSLDSAASYQLSGGTLYAGEEIIGAAADLSQYGGNSNLWQSGGSNSALWLIVSQINPSEIGNYTLAGGTLKASKIQIYNRGTFLQSGGTLTAGTALSIYSGGVATLLPKGYDGSSLELSSLTIQGNGQLNIASSSAGPGAMQVSSLSLANTSILNIQNNALIINNGIYAQAYSLIQGAYARGSWTGTGITSFTAAGDTQHLTAIGIITNVLGGSPLYSSFDGVPVSATDVLIAYTYYGDTNLDGKVDGTDYSRIDAAFLSQGTVSGWFNGDFNYDGVVNGSDYTLIDNGFNMQARPLQLGVPAGSTAQIDSAFPTVVPEPCSMILVGLAGVLMRRCTRRETMG